MRSALPSCLLLGLAVAACGKPAAPKFPQVSIPGPTSWDGTAPGSGTVSFISSLPGDATKFVDYEIDPGACTARRTIVDDVDKLSKLVTATITNPMDNAGTVAIIRNPPPPPPDGGDLLHQALDLVDAGHVHQTCRVQQTASATHQ